MNVQSQQRKSSLGILAVVAGFFVAIACGGGAGGAGGGSGAYGSGPSAMVTPSPAATGGADVTITVNSMNGAQSFSLDPGPVKVGQTVAWRNADSTTHTATGSSFDTGSIPPGATSAPITFSTAGNLAYHCSIHPSMVGTLSVTQ
jgi:plastocyanin